MKSGRQLRTDSVMTYVIVFFIVLSLVGTCFVMLRNMSRKMDDGAMASLTSTTRVIEETLELRIERDLKSLENIGVLVPKGWTTDIHELGDLCYQLGFQKIYLVSTAGQGMDSNGNPFQTTDFPFQEIALSKGRRGFSDAYCNEQDELQTTLQVPLYNAEGRLMGAVYGDVLLSQYYSSTLFHFYNDAGMTFVFDGGDGNWILKSLGSGDMDQATENIFSRLQQDGNSAEQIDAFQTAVREGRAETMEIRFSGEASFICFVPLPTSSDWYVATVIARDKLLQETAEVQQMTQLTLAAFGLALVCFVAFFANQRIRRLRAKEKVYHEAMFANVSANIDTVFLIYERKKRKVAFVSDNILRILGISRERVEENLAYLFNWCGIPDPDPDRQCFLRGELSRKIKRELRVDCPGTQTGMCVEFEMIPADMGQDIIVLTDVTKEKQRQDSLRRAMRTAEMANRAKSDFLSSVSHDIRTPMNGVIGMATIAAANLDDKERVEDCLGKINIASTHLLNIINEVLDMSKIESGKLILSEKPFDISELLQNTVVINYHAIQEKEHDFRVYIEELQHEMVVGDPMRLQQVVTNLVSNAVKYTPRKGRVVLELREKGSSVPGFGCYEIVVQDNGIGMSPAFIRRIFDPFERAEDSRLNKIQGTGLGMSIVQNIVRLMQGEVQVESQEDQGSRFCITVYLKLDEEHKLRPDERLRDLPVLVINNDHAICEQTVTMLEKIGMHGEWTDGGATAIEKVRERRQRGQPYFAVILNNYMKEMDSFEMARSIRQETGGMLPILMTAYDWSNIEKKAADAGVHRFLSRPVYKAKLLAQMESLLPGGAQEEAVQKAVFPGVRALVAEDNVLNMEIAKEILKMLEIQVETAENGKEAVEKFQDSKPGTYDLIFMDIQMPVMNGYRAAERIRSLDRADSKTIYILAMTADAFAEDIQRAKASGMNDHIAKPISLEQLVQTISRYTAPKGKNARFNKADDKEGESIWNV